MKEKCPFYAAGKCISPNMCIYAYYHFQNRQCRKGGLLKTPNKLMWMEKNGTYFQCTECERFFKTEDDAANCCSDTLHTIREVEVK